ncbi:MAG: gamma-glutamyltransferase [Alphaproteobacteria bacterium]
MSRRGRLAVLIALAAFAAIDASPGIAAPSSQAEGERGMVVTSQHEASAVGRQILAAGGNAVDAAVAVGYALAVTEPCCGNIGGGGFMLIHRAASGDTVINFRETAPQTATPGMFLDQSGAVMREASLYGYRAIGVPGTVMGLDSALAKYGRLGRAAVMAPAIALARDGFVLGAADAATLAAKAARLAKDPEAARIFLHADGTPYQPGERLVQSDLAAVLMLIAARGPDAFYRGPIADAVAAASVVHGGLLNPADFAAYHVTEAAPVSCSYRGYQVLSAPPPSAGGIILCEMLGVLSGWDLAGSGVASPSTLHLMAEAMRHAYVDRNTALGDPEFVADPRARLLSPGYAAAIRAAIDPEKATPSAALGPGVAPHERAETTHYSIVDGEGNAVSVTYTLNGYFGAGVVAPGTGFLLNDEMDDFTAKPGAPNLFGLVQGTANAIAPGKRPLSSMTPTIVEKDGRPVLVLGSPGGPRIITAVMETMTNVLDFGMAPQKAVAAPRFHHQWLPDTLDVEHGGFPAATLAALRERGYHLAEQPPWGAVELVAIDPGGKLLGVNDPRRPSGSAIGY